MNLLRAVIRGTDCGCMNGHSRPLALSFLGGLTEHSHNGLQPLSIAGEKSAGKAVKPKPLPASGNTAIG
jgi:hypothetical protein